MLDFTTTAPEYVRAVTEARQIEASRKRWTRELAESKRHDNDHKHRIVLFGPSRAERRRRALEHALDAAQAEGITVDEWFRAQHVDPALYERSDWAGLTDELTAMTRRRRHAA